MIIPEDLNYQHWEKSAIDKMAESEMAGGLNYNEAKPGESFYIQTQNTRYLLEYREDKQWYISGNRRLCPDPRPITILGSSWGGGVLNIKKIGIGMLMEFVFTDVEYPLGEAKSVATSKITDIQQKKV